MNIVLRQNGSEVGRFELTTNKSDTQTNDVIKIVKDDTTYYGRLTSDIPNTTRKLKVTKNGTSLYLQTDPVGLRWAGTLTFKTDNNTFDLVVASNIQYPKGVYRITVGLIDSNNQTQTEVEDFTVVQGGIGDFHVKQINNNGLFYTHEVWCGKFKYYRSEKTTNKVKSVTVKKIG